METNCPHCGRFIADVEATVSFDREIQSVSGFCNKCGEVFINKWDWEDFFPEETEQEEDIDDFG